MDIFKEFDAILAKPVYELNTRNNLIKVLTEDFGKLLGSNYRVLRVFDPDAPSPGRVSNYFYVFKLPKAGPIIKQHELETVIHLAFVLLGEHKDDNSSFTHDISRLKRFSKNNIISLDIDGTGNVKRIILENCVLLIRLSGHDVYAGMGDAWLYHTARKSIVDDIYYYNVDEAPGEVYVSFDNTTYGVFEKGKNRVLIELGNKLDNLDVTAEVKDKILAKVKSAFK